MNDCKRHTIIPSTTGISAGKPRRRLSLRGWVRLTLLALVLLACTFAVGWAGGYVDYFAMCR